jgi:putative redox protein
MRVNIQDILRGFKMITAVVKWVDGLRYVGESGSGHAIVMDAPVANGGTNTGMTPMELLLVAIGGCSGMDIASILKKKRLVVSDIEIKVNGEKAAEDPKRYTDIQLEFIVTGKSLPEEAVKKAIDLSMDKYCSVKATIEGSAKISYSHKIIAI